MKNIVIFGAGGLGGETVTLINEINEIKPDTYIILGFIVEDKYYAENTYAYQYPILGTEKWIIDHKDEASCVLAIGDYPNERERIFNMLERNEVEIETIIAPNARITPTCIIGRGCYIGSGVRLSNNVEIGQGTFINSQCLIGHDVKIGEFCNFYPRATISGKCIIGNKVKIGGNAYIIPKRKIGENATIASGGVVFTNVKSGTTVIGNPAKRIKAIESMEE